MARRRRLPPYAPRPAPAFARNDISRTQWRSLSSSPLRCSRLLRAYVHVPSRPIWSSTRQGPILSPPNEVETQARALGGH